MAELVVTYSNLDDRGLLLLQRQFHIEKGFIREASSLSFCI